MSNEPIQSRSEEKIKWTSHGATKVADSPHPPFRQVCVKGVDWWFDFSTSYRCVTHKDAIAAAEKFIRDGIRPPHPMPPAVPSPAAVAGQQAERTIKPISFDGENWRGADGEALGVREIAARLNALSTSQLEQALAGQFPASPASPPEGRDQITMEADRAQLQAALQAGSRLSWGECIERVERLAACPPEARTASHQLNAGARECVETGIAILDKHGPAGQQAARYIRALLEMQARTASGAGAATAFGMTTDELIALALVYGGCDGTSKVANAIPQAAWWHLHEMGYLTGGRDNTDEGTVNVTNNGRHALFLAAGASRVRASVDAPSPTTADAAGAEQQTQTSASCRQCFDRYYSEFCEGRCPRCQQTPSNNEKENGNV